MYAPLFWLDVAGCSGERLVLYSNPLLSFTRISSDRLGVFV
ncbi:hypothetical protein DMTZ50_0086 [Dehalococcoides mccartyi]|nr:hypothetical protein [Dehalococcoides mccartyi]